MSKVRQWVVWGFDFFYRFIAKQPLGVFLSGLILAVFCFFYGVTHLTFLPNFSGLSRGDAGYSKTYENFVKEFNVQPEIVVLAKGPSPQRNQRYLKALSQLLAREPSVQRVYYQIDLKPMKSWLLAYPENSVLKKIAAVIREAKPFFKALNYRVDLSNFWVKISQFNQHTASASQADSDSLLQLKQLSDLMTQKVKGEKLSSSSFEKMFNGFDSLQETRYLTLDNGKYMFLFARPVEESKLEAAVNAIRQDVNVLAPQFPDVEGHLTGEPVLGVDEMQSARHDIFWAGLVSLFLASSIFVFGFRDWRKPCLSVIALFVGLGWSLAYIALTVKHFNVFTLSLFPMLIGLAIDFSIQFLGRYQEELERLHSPLEALRITYFRTGTGLLTAALTTAVGFYAILFAPYRGVAELGMATGGSLLLCFLSTMTMLPALLLLTENREEASVFSSTLAPTMRRSEQFVFKHSFLILGIALLLTLFLGMKARHIRFDHDILHLQSSKLDSIKTELELVRVAGKSSLYAVLIAGSVPEASLYINELSQLDTVGSIQSPFVFLPKDQKQKFPILQEIRRELNDFQILPSTHPVDIPVLVAALKDIFRLVNRAEKQIAVASGSLNMLQTFILPGSNLIPHRSITTDLAHLHVSLINLQSSVSDFLKTLTAMNPNTAAIRLTEFQNVLYAELSKMFDLVRNGIPSRPMTFQDIPQEMRDQFIGKSGKIMIQIFPSQNIWDRPALERFVADLRTVSPNVTGSPILIYENTQLIRESYVQAAKIAFLVIFLAVFLQFRKIGLTFLTLIPLGVGLIWLMGFMVLFHKSYNPANLLTLPVIIGIGVAFGVYVVSRYREEGQASVFSTSTGKAVLLSALTSIAGFASLLGVGHRGLQSLGFTMTVGLLSIMIQALFVLPALLEATQKIYKRKG